MAAYKFKKDPNAELDYTFNWAPYLTPISDTIASVAWVLSAGLVQESVANTATTATIFVSGGVLNAIETITCRITTAGGRTDDRSVSLHILNR